ncbi:glycosyltransferase family 39 protein [Novimethylophilus kurashikiensis]|nr:glycosyltransferase family 39 protein [Novimethylophilus kurashikiensis]
MRLNATFHTTVLAPLRADAGEYFSYAYNLRHYDVYSRQPIFQAPDQQHTLHPDAVRSPGYSLFLLPFAGAEPTNKTVLDITLVQALLGVMMIPLVYLLGRSVLSDGWALLPSLLVAISPQLVVAGTYVLSEALFTFFFLLALLAVQKQFSHPERWAWGLLAGVLLASSALIRPTVQYLLPMIVFFGVYAFPAKFRIKQIIALAIGFIGVFGIWLLRNYLTLGILSDSTLTVSTLLHGHYPDFMYAGKPESLGYPYRFDPDAAVIGASLGSILHEIGRLFLNEPLIYLKWYFIGKPLAFLGWGDMASAGDIFTYPTLQSPYFGHPIFVLLMKAMRAIHWVWMVLGLVVTVLCWKINLVNRDTNQVNGLRIFSIVLLYFLAVHMVGFPIARYAVPLLPVMFILAVFAISWITTGMGKRTNVNSLELR